MADIYDAVDVVSFVGILFVHQEIKIVLGYARYKSTMFSIVTHDCQHFLFLSLCKFSDVADNISKAGECVCNMIHGMPLLVAVWVEFKNISVVLLNSNASE